MTDKTQSAIDLIYDIDDRLKKLEKMVQSMHSLLLADRVRSDLNIEQPEPTEEVETAPVGPPTIQMSTSNDFDFTQSKVEQKAEEPKSKPDKNKETIVSGTVKDKNGSSVISSPVLIFDSSGNEFKKTKTNRAGKWTAWLPPGNYSVQFNATGKLEMKGFIVLPNQDTLEVL